MFVDSSAFMAILLAEDDGDEMFARITASKRRPSTSPVVRFEVVMSLAKSTAKNGRVRPSDVDEAEAAFDELVEVCKIQETMITPNIARAACNMAGRFGKLAGHPARLNMGDCFSLAAAEAGKVPLLFKGNDFAAITQEEMDAARRLD